jgi:hypothetical protein
MVAPCLPLRRAPPSTQAAVPGQEPDAGQEPERRPDDPAPVVHLRVGRVHDVGKPRVIGAERLLDLATTTATGRTGPAVNDHPTKTSR